MAADTDHAFEAEGTVAHLFIDPEGREGRAVARRLFSEGRVAPIAYDWLAEPTARLLAYFESLEHGDAVLVDWGTAGWSRAWLVTTPQRRGPATSACAG